MTAISNGLALHGGFIPYDATFLVFSDYARNAVRMSALMGAHAIHVYTHDSIGLGEDGPTHQPVEHLASLRYIPHNDVWRPCDAVESAVSWRAAIERRDGPSCLVFSRQNLAHQPRSDAQVADIARGGYVLQRRRAATPELILIATGSEVGTGDAGGRTAAATGVRVVSMPSTDVFDRQDAAYRESVLPNACRKRVAIEAGVTDFWRKYVGLDGAVVGIDTLRRLGADRGADAAFRLHRRARGRGGEGAGLTAAVTKRRLRRRFCSSARSCDTVARNASAQQSRLAAVRRGRAAASSRHALAALRRQSRARRRQRRAARAQLAARVVAVFAFSQPSAFTRRCSTAVKSLPSG